MRKFGSNLLVLGVAIGLGLSFAAAPKAANAAWEPKKPIEFVIMAGKGGGADKMARFMQTIVEKHKLSSKPLTPVNKGGGSGAEALVHLKQKGESNDADHTIMVTLNSFYTTPLRQPGLGVNVLAFTPVARMAEDTFLLWVHKDSGIKTLDEFVKAAKAKGSNWIMAGTGKLQEDQLLTDFLNAEYGLKMKYVPFKGGGAVAKQLAGKHADSTVNNPSETEGFYKAGTVVPLAAFTPTRLGMFPNTPTFKELGKDYSYFMQRSVVGAPGMSKEAAAYYQALFNKVFASSEWQGYRKKNSLQGEYLTGQPLVDYWTKFNEVHRTMLVKMGAIK
jgi:tripartite-type tricarboxylate transporter receptor subunit TctC